MEAAAAEASKDRKKPETKEPFQESESLLAVQTPIVSWTRFFHLMQMAKIFVKEYVVIFSFMKCLARFLLLIVLMISTNTTLAFRFNILKGNHSNSSARETEMSAYTCHQVS